MSVDPSSRRLHAAGDRTIVPARRVAAGPLGHPVIGNYFPLQRDALGFLGRANRDYGHIFRFRVAGRQYWHHLSHPDYLEHVLQRRHTNYPKRQFAQLISLVAGNGLLALEGDAWARQRRLTQPIFHRDRLTGFAGTIQNEAQRLLDRWDRLPGRPRRVEPLVDFSRLTLAIVGRTFFSVDISDEADRFGPAFLGTLEYLNYRLMHPFALPLQVPTPRNRRYLAAVRTLNAIMTPLIEARRRGNHDAGDLLSMLLAARDDRGQGMSDLQIREEIRTMLTAGHETSAAVLAWSFLLLARHPAQEQRLHAEVDGLTAPPSFADLPRLPFTRMVIDEVLRLYPPVVYQARVAAAEDEIGGYVIRAGTPVMLGFYVMHRHPDFWERPDEFDPDRFDPARAASRPRGAYLPFGLGPRQCVGNGFALMETQLLLASIARRYRLQLESDAPVEPEILASLRPQSGIVMRLEPR